MRSAPSQWLDTAMTPLLPQDDPQLAPLINELGELIRQARQKVLRAVDTLQVQTCWQIGRHIIEFEQGGAERAAYGARLLPSLAKVLTARFGKGFDERNLRHMRDFYQKFPIWNAVRTELSWTHYRTLLRVEHDTARHWYMNEVAIQNWSTRALERQIGSFYYERLLASRDRPAVEQEAVTRIKEMNLGPRDIVRDPVVLEFLGLPNAGTLLETDLEQALIDQLQGFLLELGKGLRLRCPSATHQHRKQRLLHRPGLLQLPAQVLCDRRPQAWRAEPPGHRANGYVCAPLRRAETRPR